MDTNKDRYTLQDLKDLMARLRDKDNGCPWDVEQDFNTIKPHTIEEAYEVADAIERGDMIDLKDELGDLLFQVIFHSQMASEQGSFTMDDVIDHVTKKMIFRHPHVFGDDKAETADDVKDNIWEAQKAKEGKAQSKQRYLDDVTRALPSLLLAHKVQKRVCKAGFTYPNLEGAMDKMYEEIAELTEAVHEDNNAHIYEEYGDFLFTAALLGYHLKINPEDALRDGVLKFIGRFNAMENQLPNGLSDSTLDEMQAVWQDVKQGGGSQKP